VAAECGAVFWKRKSLNQMPEAAAEKEKVFQLLAFTATLEHLLFIGHRLTEHGFMLLRLRFMLLLMLVRRGRARTGGDKVGTVKEKRL
jgi:hypothetical protein